MKVRHDLRPAEVYGRPAMRKQHHASDSTAAGAIVRPLEPTLRQLAVLDAYAETGSYGLAAAATGIPPMTVRNVLIEVRGWYGAETTIQAYRAALAAGDLSAPTCHQVTGRS